MIKHYSLPSAMVAAVFAILFGPGSVWAQFNCLPQNISIEPLDPIFCNGQQNALVLTPSTWNQAHTPPNNGQYSASWEMSSDGTNWAEAPGTPSGSPYYLPTNLSGPRWFRVLLSCSDGSSYYTDPYEVFPLIEGFMVGDQSLCPDGSTEFSFGFPYHDIGTLPVTAYNWRHNFEWVLLDGPSSMTITQPGNWAGQVELQNSLGTCWIPIEAVNLTACDFCPTATPMYPP